MARNIFERFRKKARQFEATRGRPIAPSVSKRFLEAEIGAERERVSIEAERADIRRARGVAEEQRADEIRAQRGANIVSGGIGLVEAGATLSDTKLGGFIGDKFKGAAKEVAPSLFGAPEAITTATTLPSATGVGALTGGEFATPLTGTTATASGVAPTLAGTAASAALPAAVGGFAGSKLSEAIGGEGKGQRNTGRTLGAAGTGFAFGGPVGLAVGGIIGLAQSETVICTELYRQGYIPTKVFTLDDYTRHSDITERIYSGYMRWAPTVVKGMRKSWLLTQIVRPFAVGWAYHMAHRLDDSIPDSFIGKVIYKIGIPVCRFLGRKHGKFIRIIR